MNSYIKVIGYRIFENTKEKKWLTKQVFFDQPYNFESHSALFNSLEGFLSTLDPNELYNLHYTLNHIPKDAKNKKAFFSYNVIPFDLDTIDKTRKELYIQVVEETLKLNRTQMSVIDSGNGLHFLIELKTPLHSEDEMTALKESYDILCDLMLDKLKEKDLIFKTTFLGKEKQTNFDKQVFRVGTLRLPETRNIKYDPKTGMEVSNTQCKFITKFMLPVDLSDIGLQRSEDIVTSSFDPDKYWGKTDSEYIFNNCASLKYFIESKGNVSYAQWFSAASIIARLNDIDGVLKFHEISKGHHSYSESETQALISNTLDNGGPHKCDTFRRSYSQCEGCTLKCKTPLQLRSKKHLKYEDKGFHIYSNGKWNPNYKEMLIKVNQDYNYKVKGNNRELWMYHEDQYLWKMWEYNDFRSYISSLMDNKPGDLARTTTKNEVEHQVLDRNPLDADYFMDKSKGKVNFQNGFLSIKNSNIMFTRHSAESFKEGFLYCLPFSYDANAKAPNFDQFLSDICLEREDLKLQIMEYLGYCLSNDDIWIHKAMILKGEGANGKSVLLEVIKSMIGQGAYSILSLKQLQDVESRAQLIGAIANIADETPKDSLFDAEEFKKLVSGGEFEYRILYKGKGMARNRAKFIFSANNELHISDKSSGVLRRLIVIPMDANFDHKIGPVTKEPDPFIIDKLKEEQAGILNLCLNAYLKAKERRDFTVSKASEDVLKEFSEGSNPIRAYFNETVNMNIFKNYIELQGDEALNYIEASKAGMQNFNEAQDSFNTLCFVPSKALRSDFMAWCEEKGIKTTYGEVGFSREFSRLIKTSLGAIKAEQIKDGRKVGKKFIRGFILPWQPATEDEY